MRFALVDKIVFIKPGSRISTVKTLTLAEEYLADHFPRFPVMPGVLMLESMAEAGAWLIRVTDDFAHSMITLRQARNIRFRSFVAPGQVLSITADILRRDEHETRFEARGCVGDQLAVSGQLTLAHANLADRRPDLAGTDAATRGHFRRMLPLLLAADAYESTAGQDALLTSRVHQETPAM